METRAGRRALRPRSCLCLEGETPTARRARWTSLFGVDLWRADETKKARSVVALSCVPRGERGSPVSPPAAGRCSGRGPSSEPGSLPQGYPSPESEPLSLATVRPLVRMSTDQHAATGTCECWAGLRYVRFPSISRAFLEISSTVLRRTPQLPRWCPAARAAAAWQWTAQAASLNCRAIACPRPSFRVPIDAASDPPQSPHRIDGPRGG